MPQDKKRVYRNRMLSERRRLQKAVELLAAGESIAATDQPLTAEGVPMTAAQIRDRITDLERQLHLKPSESLAAED